MLAFQKIHLAPLEKAANANLFKDDICLEYVVSKQKFLPPSPGPREMWPKENMNRVFHFVSHQSLLRGRVVGKSWPPHPKHPSSICPSKRNAYFFPHNLPLAPKWQNHSLQENHTFKKLFVLAVLFREVEFSWKVNIPCQRGNKNKCGTGNDDIWIQTKVCLLLPPPLQIIHWSAKKNSPDLAFHKPFGVAHIYSLSPREFACTPLSKKEQICHVKSVCWIEEMDQQGDHRGAVPVAYLLNDSMF